MLSGRCRPAEKLGHLLLRYRQTFEKLTVAVSEYAQLIDMKKINRLDGFIEPAFFQRKTREWGQSQASIAEQIAQYEDANQEYFKDGVRLLELSRKAYFLFKKQNPHEKRRLLNFVCSNSTWRDRTLTATFRQPFDILAVTNTAWQRQKAAGDTSSDLRFLSGSAGRTRTRSTLF